MRSIWSGSISFSLVNIPIKLYSATAGEKISFDLLHGKDLSPIRYAKVCKKEGEEVPFEDIVKGYEYQKGQYVVIDEEDFRKANARKTSTIDIDAFVDESEIDSIYYEKPYYLGPDKGSHKSFAVFREALKKSKKVAVAKYVLRNKERPAVLKAENNAIVLNQMRYSDDIRSHQELDLPSDKVEQPEIDLALKVIDYLARPFKPEDYKDTYKQEMIEIIKEKAAGKIPAVRGEAPQPTEVRDLMAVLQESLQQVQH